MKAFINTSFNYMTIKPWAGNDNNQRTTEKNKYIISFSHIRLHRVHIAMNGIRTLVVIVTDSTGSCISNYHTSTTTTAPLNSIQYKKVDLRYSTFEHIYVFYLILVSSTNKTDHHDITEILLKVALNTIKKTFTIQCIEQYLSIVSI
jgi:hypothetical protein